MLEEWPCSWTYHLVLASGTHEFFYQAVVCKLSAHTAPCIYAMDMVFSGHRLVCGVQGFYKAWGVAIWHKHGFDSLVLEHLQFGGVSSATHLVTFQGINRSMLQLG
jgi:hypothetical protein